MHDGKRTGTQGKLLPGNTKGYMTRKEAEKDSVKKIYE